MLKSDAVGHGSVRFAAMDKLRKTKITAALAGNPNVGKSTVFNALTGLKQHTGNWAGKTVDTACGCFELNNTTVEIVDLPGIYSLACHSPEEEAARDYITDASPDCVICVCDACCLERSLILAMQLREISDSVIICVNLIDEAQKKGIRVDSARLRELTGCTVVETAARNGHGLAELKSAVLEGAECDEMDKAVAAAEPVRAAEYIASKCVSKSGDPTARDRRLDRIICGKFTALPAMLMLCAFVFWLTLSASGYFSDALELLLGAAEIWLRQLLTFILPVGADWLVSMLCDGVIGTVFRVTAVMLPPMAIFFPLFTLLEDAGFLPRVAFNLDRCFKCCGSCGKQSLTMLMGLGCNACGVTGCRIIDSPRERLIAIITNSLIPCNGRFPAIITAVSCISAAVGGAGSIKSALVFLLTMLCSILMTLAVSAFLSSTILRGRPSSFTLELPPYRRPQIGRVIVRSILDRTIFVLGRAVTAAAPAGLLIWITNEISIGDRSLYSCITAILDPIGRVAGMDGVLLAAFIFALPAAELMIPLAIAGGNTAVGMSLDAVSMFTANGWTGVTAVCILIFTLFHFPCATTLMTIKHETNSRYITLLSAVIPTVIGYALCAAVNLVFRILM